MSRHKSDIPFVILKDLGILDCPKILYELDELEPDVWMFRVARVNGKTNILIKYEKP